MNFAYPEFLWGLSAISIPIIIHLFNFRKFKKVYFTNVRFLQEVKQETQSKSQLKHLLVLLMRILAIVFLVLAFAQPFIPGDATNNVVGDKAVSVYLDNSFSMDAVNTNGRLLELAKNQAIQVANGFKATDKFQLLTNDFEGRHQRLVNREEFLELVEEVSISPATKNLNEVIARQSDILSQSGSTSRNAFVFSDFQKSVSDFDALKQDSTIDVVLVPLQAEESSNVFIDSIWFETPVRQLGQQEQLKVRIINTGDQRKEDLPMKLSINGSQKALTSFSIDAQSSVDTSLFFTNSTPGIQQAVVSITDYPITFDDKFYFAFEVADQIPLLVIRDASRRDSSRLIRSLYETDVFYNYSEVSERNVDYSTLANYNLIIINELNAISTGLQQELSKYVENGGSLILIPSATPELSSYNLFLQKIKAGSYTQLDTTNNKVAKINLEHPVYKNIFEKLPDNIDLPVTQQHFGIRDGIISNSEQLLSLRSGDAFLSQHDFGKGKAYRFAVPLEDAFSNLTRHAVFVASMLRIAELSLPTNKLYYTISRDESLEINNFKASGENTFLLANEATEYEIVPEHKNFAGKTNIFLHQQIKDAGAYLLSFANENVSGLGFNYQRSESQLTAYTPNEISENLDANGLFNYSILENKTNDTLIDLEEINETKLWKLCILLVLLFLAFEVLLLKFWKT